MLERFFGGPPGAVVFRLIVLSIVVGVVLTALGLSPFDIVDSLRRMVQRIYNMGFEAVEWVFRYFLLGAVIVFPVWLISRVWRTVASPDPLKHDADTGRRTDADSVADSMADTPGRDRY